MNTKCSCNSQMLRSASILGLHSIYQEDKKSDWTKVKIAMINRIYNTFSDNNYILVRPVGDCEILKELPFLALKKIRQKNRLIIKARRKNWVLSELQSLGAFPDIIDHVNNYEDDSPEMTLLGQALFYGTRFDVGRHLVEQLVQYIELTEGANQLIRSVYDPEFREINELFILKWAAILEHQANLADDAASRAKLLANHLIELGMSNPESQSAVRKIIKANCWNLFSKPSLP